jgi:hypothetical protein
VAYNTLSGRGLSPAEQESAIAVDKLYNTSGPEQGDYFPNGRTVNSPGRGNSLIEDISFAFLPCSANA